MKESRKGRQTPTQYVSLPYIETEGQGAIELYNSTGRTAQEWQELIIADILAVNEDGLWVHSKYGYSVPRRNGKNEIVAIREMWGLKNGEHILHTAHRTATSHAAWERLLYLLEKSRVPIASSYKASGKERIELENGGRAEFRTRTSKGGLGEGFDLLVIDEAQEYQDDQETALKYVVSDSSNPQTLFCGTPPTPVSSGTVFAKFRQEVLQGLRKNSGWAEWSVEKMTDVQDREKWYETNPSMGTILTERKVEDEIGPDEVDFNIQRLGFWIQYNLKSEISEKQWQNLKIDYIPELKGKLYVGIKYGRDGANTAMSIAVKTEDGNIFVETIDCQPTSAGNGWIIRFLKEAEAEKIVIDGAGNQTILESEIKEAKIKKKIILPTVKEVIVANALFKKGLDSENIRHAGQPSLVQSVCNCEKRIIGSGGGFGYKSLKEDIDVSLLDSVILAYWQCAQGKERRKQKVSY